MITRVRITHQHDLFKGKIGYVLKRIDQHSLCTYVVKIKDVQGERAYQRNEIKFLSSVKNIN